MSLSGNRLSDLFKETSSKIAAYLNEDSINEILVNPDGKVWIDTFKEGRIETAASLSPEERGQIICLVAGISNQTVSYDKPEIAIELPDTGERFQGLIPPLVEYPAFSIRKHCSTPLTLNDYVESQCLTNEQAAYIKESIAKRKNIIICGGTSSGKTTFGNAILNEISHENHRILILEDTRELKCVAKDVVQMKTTLNCSMRDLIRISLRLRPDRIIVGEVRGGEALELLKAWGTGHPGGIATLHAESAQDCLYRLEDLILESVSSKQTRLIANSIDLIIYLERVNNLRRVKEMVEVKNISIGGSDYEFNQV